jgi:hypothetical protein
MTEIASLKETRIDEGTLPTLLESGVKVLTVAPVLSTVITELSFDTTDTLPRLSSATPPSTCRVKVPFPLHADKVIVAPVMVIESTATVHEELPVNWVKVTAPPAAVRLPLSVVPPAAEAAISKAKVDRVEEFTNRELGVARLKIGALVMMV